MFQLPAWWAQWLLLLLLTECRNVLTAIYNAFLLLFHCCIMLEIKLTTTATATATAATTNSTTATTTTMYTIKDAGTCTLTQHLLVFRRKLHLHPVCWLRNRLFLIWLVWTGLQFCTDLCSSDHCWGKCNLVISITFYTWKTSVAGQYLVLWHHTSTGLPAVHQHLCPTRGPWDLGQPEVVTENAPDDSLVSRAWMTCTNRNPHMV